MGEFTHTEAVNPTKSIQLWRTLWNWLAFFYHIFLQILRTLGHLPLISSSSANKSFSPLPAIELPEIESPDTPSETFPSPISSSDTPINSGHKLTVVLDLDETLVCSYETSNLPTVLRNRDANFSLKAFEIECVSSDKEQDGKPKTNNVTVFERPGLDQFLKQLSEFADLVLFTAGLEGYAKPLVDRIDVGNVFRLRLYRPSTVSTAYREHVKDLSCLSIDPCRVVLVDNNPFSFLLQPLNGIPCASFSAVQPNDSQLLDVILPLLKQLAEMEDVRPFLHERYHMPEWFQRHGIPSSL